MTATLTSASDDVYHPEWLAFEKALGARPTLTGDLQVDNAVFNQMGKDLAKQWPPLAEPLTITEETIQSENIKIRTYTPENHETDDLPLMLYFHGGGFLSGDLETEDPHCRILAAKTPCVVANVEYPLAPGKDMDGIIDAGLKVVEWARSHTPPLSPSSKLLLAGGSAGATLALQLTQHFASQSSPSPISGLILIQVVASPAAINPYSGPYAERHTSTQEKAEGAPFLNQLALRNMIEVPRMSITSARHFPLLSPTLSDFPRTYVVTSEHDPARDDGRVLALRLNDESERGAVEVCYEGMPHWFQWFPSVPMAGVMMERTVKGVRWVLGKGTGDWDEKAGSEMGSAEQGREGDRGGNPNL